MLALLVAMNPGCSYSRGELERPARMLERLAEAPAPQLDVGEVDEGQAFRHLRLRLARDRERSLHGRKFPRRVVEKLERRGLRHPCPRHSVGACGHLGESEGLPARFERVLALLHRQIELRQLVERLRSAIRIVRGLRGRERALQVAQRLLDLAEAAGRDADRHRRPIGEVRIRGAVDERTRFLRERVGLCRIARQRFDVAAHEKGGGAREVVANGARFPFQARRQPQRVGVPSGRDQRLPVQGVDEAALGGRGGIGLGDQCRQIGHGPLRIRVEVRLDLAGTRGEILRCDRRRG